MDIGRDRQKGLSYTELGKTYHMDLRTAKRYAESPSRPEYTLTGPKPTKLDPYSCNERRRLSRGYIHGGNAVFGNDGTWEAAVWSAGQKFSFQEGQYVKKPAP